MKLTPATTLAALVLMTVGGFMAGRISSPPPADAAKFSQAGSRNVRSGTTSSMSGAERSSRKSAADRASASSQESSTERLAKLESIMRGENPLERNRALLAYIDQLAPGDFEEAIASFRNLGITESRMGEYSLLLTAWAGADPTNALKFAQENTRNGFARDTVLTAWATNDPDAAVRWAESNYEGDGANPFMAGIIRGVAGLDPAKATELLTSMPRSEERGRGLEFMLPHLLQQGSDQTRSWIDAISDDSLKNGAIIRVADNLAQKDPAGTAAWLMANPGEGQQRRMDDVYGVWASQDSQAAMASFTALPAGETRSNALRGLVSNAAANDPQEAVNLMNRYPADVTDGVVQNVIWHSFGSDPAIAASQISRITDQGQRDNTYRRTLSYWMDKDPASAQAWIRTNPLPDAVRQQLARKAAGG